ncbi:MAG TPA: hypothetical protein PLE24_15560 [Chitinispirillaceae bacterium]|jgi:hypothetical protein|nr:hypothetical protein [Chitinispirillaceae bacterium]
MKLHPAALIFLVLSLSIMGAPLSRIIGNESTFSAKITIESTDTTESAYDSICPNYWFVKYKMIPNDVMDYDYRITIHRKAVEPGRISISFWGFKGDTLECGSFGSASITADTVRADTTVYYWNYLRLLKRQSEYFSVKMGNEVHLKIHLKSASVNDSIVFSRPYLEYTGTFHPVKPDKGKIFREPGRNRSDGVMIYDIRGRSVTSVTGSSQVLIMKPGDLNSGSNPQKVFLSER